MKIIRNEEFNMSSRKWKASTIGLGKKKQEHPSLIKRKLKKLKTQNSVQDLWDTIKQTSIHILGIPDRVKGENTLEDYSAK